MDAQQVLIDFDDRPITVADVVSHLKITGAFESATNRLIEIAVIRQEIERRGIMVTDNERLDHLGAKRQVMGLTGAADLNDYCHRNGIHPEQWKRAVEASLLRKKLFQEFSNHENIESYFNQHKERLKRLCIARIVCKDRKEADRLKALILADNSQFAPLARQHSMEHNSRIAGGHLGCVGLGVLPHDIEQDLFSSEAGSIRGPYPQNGYWAIYLVEEVLHDNLTETTRNMITDQLFSEWLRERVLDIQNKVINQENQYG
jgi:hypothetical protein